MKSTNRFARVIIIGYGKIVGDVLSHVLSKQEIYDYSVEFIEYEVPRIGGKSCENDNRIIFYKMHDKKDMTAYLLSIREKALIISAGNNYIFPVFVVNQPNLTILNFHNALLPKYPGQHAPTWAIYMGEKESGCTWHFVNEDIDGGAIIIQKSCAISGDEKAYQLAHKIMNLAASAFVEIYENVLQENASSYPQGNTVGRKIYFSHEKPNDGKFNLSDNPEMIYRLLRSMDWGPTDIMDYNCTVLPSGENVKIIRYSKITKTDGIGAIETPMIDLENRHIYLQLDDKFVLRMKYTN